VEALRGGAGLTMEQAINESNGREEVEI